MLVIMTRLYVVPGYKWNVRNDSRLPQSPQSVHVLRKSPWSSSLFWVQGPLRGLSLNTQAGCESNRSLLSSGKGCALCGDHPQAPQTFRYSLFLLIAYLSRKNSTCRIYPFWGWHVCAEHVLPCSCPPGHQLANNHHKPT